MSSGTRNNSADSQWVLPRLPRPKPDRTSKCAHMAYTCSLSVDRWRSRLGNARSMACPSQMICSQKHMLPQTNGRTQNSNIAPNPLPEIMTLPTSCKFSPAKDFETQGALFIPGRVILGRKDTPSNWPWPVTVPLICFDCFEGLCKGPNHCMTMFRGFPFFFAWSHPHCLPMTELALDMRGRGGPEESSPMPPSTPVGSQMSNAPISLGQSRHGYPSLSGFNMAVLIFPTEGRSHPKNVASMLIDPLPWSEIWRPCKHARL
jgi:hypothetical protein